MCGRYWFDDGEHAEIQQIVKQLKMELHDSVSQHEVFPSNQAIVCVHSMEPKIMTWGYQKWDNKGRVINARSETVKSSKFFNQDSQPCIVLASGYFEWNKAKEKIYFTSSKVLYMAGIYNSHQEFTILTQNAIPPYSYIHDRMPVLFSLENANRYLNLEQVQPDFYPEMIKNLSQAKRND